MFSNSIESHILHDRRISYAILDTQFIVQYVKGPVFPGLEPEAVLGQPLLALVPELIGGEPILAAILAGQLPRFEIPMVGREASDLPTGIRYQNLIELPYQDADGEIRGLIHVVEDVTIAGHVGQQVMQHRNELHLLQQALREQNMQLLAANAELRRLDEAKSAFVALAAHELRTPLASITGYLEMLLDGDAGELRPRQVEYLRVMEQSAGRLRHITRDMLDVNRLETGQLQLVLQPTDLFVLVNGVIAEQLPQIELLGQHLELIARPPLPLALCDAFRAAQIFGNLLSNASKFSPPRSRITIELQALGDSADFIQIVVADRGVGIDEADYPHLFRPFFRAANAERAGVSGTGLGLYIAHSLTELHGGAITFDSVPGQGSTFRITLPTASRSYQLSAQAPAFTRDGQSASISASPAYKYR